MIWWQGKQREKWESINKLFSCVSTLVLTITSATQKKLFCHQWILTRLCEEKLSSFLKNATKLNFFCINSSLKKYASTGNKYLCGLRYREIKKSGEKHRQFQKWTKMMTLTKAIPRRSQSSSMFSRAERTSRDRFSFFLSGGETERVNTHRSDYWSEPWTQPDFGNVYFNQSRAHEAAWLYKLSHGVRRPMF